GGAAGEADLAGHAPEVDDAAAAPGRHLGGEGGDEEVRRPDVRGEKAVEGSHIEIRCRPEPAEAGVVDQDVDCAGLLDEVVERGRVAEIGGDEAGLAAV